MINAVLLIFYYLLLTLYGQAKVHKPVINNYQFFRTTLLAFNTPLCKLAKFFVQILSPLTTNEFNVEDCFVFAKEITNTDSSYVLAC